MFNKLLAGALTAAIVSVGAVAYTSAAETGAKGLNEIKPRHGFSQALGSKQAVGFFESETGQCMVTVMVAEALDETALSVPPSAIRLQVALEPTESTSIDSAESQMLTITCGADARTIALSTGVTPVM